MKKYQVRILHTAQQDLLGLIEYAGRFSRPMAAELAQAVKKGIDSLEERPRKYPVYDRQPIFRKLVVQDILIFYVVHETPARVEIYRIIHGRRDLT